MLIACAIDYLPGFWKGKTSNESDYVGFLAAHPDFASKYAPQKFAMRVGGQDRSDWVLKDNWERLAGEAGVGGKAVLDLCRELGEKAPAAAQPLAAAFTKDHGAKETIDKIAKNVSSMSKKMLEALKV